MSQLKEAIEKLKKAQDVFWTDMGFTWEKVKTQDVLPLIDQALALLRAEEPEAGEFTKECDAFINHFKKFGWTGERDIEKTQWAIKLRRACDIIDRQADKLKELKEELQELSDQMMGEYERWDEPERGTLLGWHERIDKFLRV